MKVAIVNTFDVKNISNWSGIPFHISLFLESILESEIKYIKIPKLRRDFKSYLLGFFYNKIINKIYYTWADNDFLINNAKIIDNNIDEYYDLIITFDFYLVPILRKHGRKIIHWNDANFSNLYNFYPGYSNFPKYCLNAAHRIQKKALDLSDIVIYSSDWAINSAVAVYGVDSNKFRKISFASNFKAFITDKDVEGFVKNKQNSIIKLLFLSADWERKGGDDAVSVVDLLNKREIKCLLYVVGSDIPAKHKSNNNIISFGFIDKKTLDGEKKLVELFKECSFLILPSRVDLTPVAISEAGSFALPTITTNIGGITSIIEQNENGIYYETTNFVELASNYIEINQPGTMRYEKLCYSSFIYYQNNLSWEQVKRKFLLILDYLFI